MHIRRLSKCALAASLFGATLVTPAISSAATALTTISVADIQPSPDWTGQAEGSPPFSAFSVELSAGDTFDYTISFLAGQKLTINDLSFIWAYSYADQASDVTGTGSLSLLDANGQALYTSDVITTDEGQIHFGQQFSSSNFTGLPDSVTFSGLRYVGTLDAYADPSVTTRIYDRPAFVFSAASFTAAVPEPETYAMLLAGLGVMGLVVRRRKAAKTS